MYIFDRVRLLGWSFVNVQLNCLAFIDISPFVMFSIVQIYLSRAHSILVCTSAGVHVILFSINVTTRRNSSSRPLTCVANEDLFLHCPFTFNRSTGCLVRSSTFILHFIQENLSNLTHKG